MSYSFITDVFCDSCGDWIRDPTIVSRSGVRKRQAWLYAKRHGWTRSGGDHLCTRCSARTSPDSQPDPDQPTGAKEP